MAGCLRTDSSLMPAVDNRAVIGAGLGVAAVLALVSTGVIWIGSEQLERGAGRLSRYYGLPVAVHGAVVVAVGSSFPELSSVVISTVLHGEFSLGVGAIVGSAIFNLLVIPAVSAIASEELEATRDIVHKDAQFYIISVLVLFLTFALGATYVPGGTNEAAILTPTLALLPLVTYGVYVFLQYQDTRDHAPSPPPDIDLGREWGDSSSRSPSSPSASRASSAPPSTAVSRSARRRSCGD